MDSEDGHISPTLVLGVFRYGIEPTIQAKAFSGGGAVVNKPYFMEQVEIGIINPPGFLTLLRQIFNLICTVNGFEDL